MRARRPSETTLMHEENIPWDIHNCLSIELHTCIEILMLTDDILTFDLCTRDVSTLNLRNEDVPVMQMNCVLE